MTRPAADRDGSTTRRCDLRIQGWTVGPLARRLGLIVPARLGPLDKVELELPGSAHHELLAYTVVPGSPVARGQRIPRWARPSLVVREGRSMRFQDMGRLMAGGVQQADQLD